MAPLVWLVTGCSTGFGAAFVQSILRKGDKVIATCRGNATSRLSHLPVSADAVLTLDVSSSQSDLDTIVAEAIKIYGHIDVLVNNAGYIEAGTLEESNNEDFLNGLEANALGPIRLARAVLGHMRPRRSGYILFVGSIANYVDTPCSSIYAAGKGMIDAVAAVLAKEVEPFGIRVANLVPGNYRTNAYTAENIRWRAVGKISDYTELNALMQGYVSEANGKQPGDPLKATALIVDVVHGDGQASGKPWPLRLPLGREGLKVVREDCRKKLQVCDDWEAVSSATEFGN